MLRIPTSSSPHASYDGGFARPDGFDPLDLGVEAALGAPNLGNAHRELGQRTPDRLAAFAPMATAVRLVTIAIGLILAAPSIIAGDFVVTGAAVLVTGYSTMRAIRPITFESPRSVNARLVSEAALFTLVILLTESWASPFLFTPLTTIVIAAFAQGLRFSLQLALAAASIISAVHVAFTNDLRIALSTAATWSALYLIFAVVSSVGRDLSGEAESERNLALDRLGRLADANALLYSLHKVAQTLPSSLDMDDVAISTIGRLRELLEFDAVAILLFDETSGDWDIVRQEGLRLPQRLSSADLPRGLLRAVDSDNVVRCDFLGGLDGPGLSERSGSALYSALRTRDVTTGLIAVERRANRAFDHRSSNLLSGFVPPLALALDNAMWFSRLRTVGANEERNRIARDLHDRIGQSLAYLAFELDRLINHSRQNLPIDDALEQLREDLRGVVREVRDTLYDLRTDVSERVPLEETLANYIQRVQERSGIDIVLKAVSTKRLPIVQERELWRIAQEALTNIERHSRATEVTVVWHNTDTKAVIRVIDNGIGFQMGHSGRLDSYGMLGMRERASSIGATLEVQSTPGNGTAVTCVLESSDQSSRSPDRSLPGART